MINRHKDRKFQEKKKLERLPKLPSKIKRKNVKLTSVSLKNLNPVNQSINNLEYATKEILNDEKIFNLVNNGLNLNNFYDELSSKIIKLQSSLEEGEINEDLETMKNNLDNISKTFKNRNIILASVKINGNILHKATEFQNDIEIVTKAVKTNGSALQFASQELKSNKGVVLAAVNKNCNAILWSSEELKNDIEILSVAVRQNHCALKFVPYNLRNQLQL